MTAMEDKHEPMTDERLAEIRHRWQWRRKAKVMTVYGQSELFHEWVDHVADDETALLAEVERLRAENHGWEQVAAEERRTREIAQERYGNLLGEKSRLELRVDDLEAEIVAMRPIVEAVANHADNSYGVCLVCGFDSDDHGPGCPAEQARVFIGEHPAKE